MRRRVQPAGVVVTIALLAPLLVACAGNDNDAPPTALATIAITTTVPATEAPATESSATTQTADSAPATEMPTSATTEASESSGEIVDDGEAIDRPPPDTGVEYVQEGGFYLNAFDSDQDGFMTFEESFLAVEYSIGLHQWPDAYQVTYEVWEAHMRAFYETAGIDTEQIGLVQNGYEYTAVGIHNECAWYMDWLDARAAGDKEREAVALDAILNILPENPSSQRNPQVREWMARYAQQALLGDPSGIQQSVNANCLDKPFVTPEPEGARHEGDLH